MLYAIPTGVRSWGIRGVFTSHFPNKLDFRFPAPPPSSPTTALLSVSEYYTILNIYIYFFSLASHALPPASASETARGSCELANYSQ